MYRDELGAATERIDALQRRLDAQAEELTRLRQQVAKRRELPASAPRRWRTRAMVALGAASSFVACAAVGAWLVTGPSPKKPKGRGKK